MPLYLITYLILFWVPVIIMGFWNWPTLTPSGRRAFWWTVAILTVATFAMEYVYLWLDIWTFSEQIDPLLGVRWWGVPVEEFVFWWGATPLFLLMYLSFSRVWKKTTAHG